MTLFDEIKNSPSSELENTDNTASASPTDAESVLSAKEDHHADDGACHHAHSQLELEDENATEGGQYVELFPEIDTPQSLEDKYRFIREIAHGAQGRVYLAVRCEDSLLVVIKQLNIGSVKTWKEYELFQREAKVLESLNIPGVAKFYEAIDCLEDDPPCSYIVQEFISGQSLRQMLECGHHFAVTEVYGIIIQILTILKHLQQRTPPIIHRDIKPSNIMLTEHGRGYYVTLIDFGAVANPQVQSGGSTVAGTYGYMPPEQLMGKPEPASDIYALGALAVELFSGKSPANLPHKDFRMIFEPEIEQMPPELIATLRQMLEPSIENRLSDIPTLIDSFEQYRANNFSYTIKKEENIDKVKEFNDALEKVENIFDDNNMKLWQFLSDKPDRKCPAILIDYYYPEKSGKNTSRRSRVDSLRYNLKIIFFLIVILASLVSAAFFFLIFGFFGTLALFFIFVIVRSLYEKLFITTETYNRRKERIPGIVETEDVMDLIRYGRKTMATIVGIEYFPVELVNPFSKSKAFRCDNFMVNQAPNFKIQYSFNPPDDARREDLIHECIVHDAPEGLYQIGDLIPILYEIESSFYEEKVTSMPFPFPYETMTPKELIGTSTYTKAFKHTNNNNRNRIRYFPNTNAYWGR